MTVTHEPIRVPPRERFVVRVNRRLYTGPGRVYFRHQDRYYQCPACGRRTLVRFRDLDAFKPAPSSFPEELQHVFDRIKTGSHEATFDFWCGGCGRPVRLVYWMQERGMGGPWDAYVTRVLELGDEERDG